MTSKQHTQRKKCHMLLWKVQLSCWNSTMTTPRCFQFLAFWISAWLAKMSTHSTLLPTPQQFVWTAKQIQLPCSSNDWREMHTFITLKGLRRHFLEQSVEWIWCQSARFYWFSQIRLQNLLLRFYSYQNRVNICALVSVHVCQREAPHTFPGFFSLERYMKTYNLLVQTRDRPELSFYDRYRLF